MIKIFHVGGDPTEIAFLAETLSKKVDVIQANGWVINNINCIINTRAWDRNKQKYVETPEYIICAYKAD